MLYFLLEGLVSSTPHFCIGGGIIQIWDEIMTAQEASIKLGMNPKYIYQLWRRGSDLLLKGSVEMKGSTLLITKDGYDHLEHLTKIESDLAINRPKRQVSYEVGQALLSSPVYLLY